MEGCIEAKPIPGYDLTLRHAQDARLPVAIHMLLASIVLHERPGFEKGEGEIRSTSKVSKAKSFRLAGHEVSPSLAVEERYPYSVHYSQTTGYYPVFFTGPPGLSPFTYRWPACPPPRLDPSRHPSIPTLLPSSLPLCLQYTTNSFLPRPPQRET